MSELVPYQSPGSLAANAAETVIPALVADAGEHATRRFLEFFAATIRNKNTRVAYYNAVRRFFAWCESRGIDGLERIEPPAFLLKADNQTALGGRTYALRLDGHRSGDPDKSSACSAQAQACCKTREDAGARH